MRRQISEREILVDGLGDDLAGKRAVIKITKKRGAKAEILRFALDLTRCACVGPGLTSPVDRGIALPAAMSALVTKRAAGTAYPRAGEGAGRGSVRRSAVRRGLPRRMFWALAGRRSPLVMSMASKKAMRGIADGQGGKRSAPEPQRMPEALTMNPLLSVEDAATA